ncbi:STAS domain-containing protein [Streptomyces hokutonensis]|uniref:STAS domain-containing protein n=1 Tax=Streptomyces hokutonensis TaxID=1306990 RepID=UPI0009965C38
MGGVPGSLVGDVSVAPGRLLVQLRPPPRHRDRIVVRLRGELAASRAPRVRKRLLRAFARAPDLMEVDLGKVTYLAPEVRRLLLAAAAFARRSGMRFVISRASPLSLRVLDELGMRRLTEPPFPARSCATRTRIWRCHPRIPRPLSLRSPRRKARSRRS